MKYSKSRTYKNEKKTLRICTNKESTLPPPSFAQPRDNFPPPRLTRAVQDQKNQKDQRYSGGQWEQREIEIEIGFRKRAASGIGCSSDGSPSSFPTEICHRRGLFQKEICAKIKRSLEDGGVCEQRPRWKDGAGIKDEDCSRREMDAVDSIGEVWGMAIGVAVFLLSVLCFTSPSTTGLFACRP